MVGSHLDNSQTEGVEQFAQIGANLDQPGRVEIPVDHPLVKAVLEEAAKVADEIRERFGSPTGSAYDNGLWDQSVRIATAIRALASPTRS